MFKKIFLAMVLAFALLAPAQAQTPIDVPTILSGLKLDIGTGYDIKNNQWVETDTIRFLEYAKTDNASGFLNFIGKADPSANIGYSTTDKLVVGVSANLVTPPMLGLTSPLLQFVAIRPFAEYSFYHIGSNVTNIKNSWIFGATIIKGQF